MRSPQPAFRRLLFLCAFMFSARGYACETPASVCMRSTPGSFALIHNGQPASVFVDASADPAVQRVADSFTADLERVGQKSPHRIVNVHEAAGALVIIGVLGQSDVIDEL